ncbi:tyrosine-type recombinase/integrase [Nocardia sp. NPDC047648]|uniref:tyrosine-type recombinase/integrase n=1 Tax=Nocardia sp. NPDC047648 TaxID=3155625 RepID=UPI0033E5FCF9
MTSEDVSTALHLISRLGLKVEDLLDESTRHGPAPTFAQYIAQVSASASEQTLKNYGSYWKVLEQRWGDRPISEPTYTEIEQLVSEHRVRAGAAGRSNSRGGVGAAATLVSAIRKLYRHAELDRLIHPLDNPAARVRRARQPRSPRHALSLDHIRDIGHVAATTGNDRPLDALIVRILIETACRRGGLLGLTIDDLNSHDCLVRLREKGGTVRWQPVSPTLMKRILEHIEARGGAEANQHVLRYRDGRPVGVARIDNLFERIRKFLPWASSVGVSAHWVRHTTLTFVEREFGMAVSSAYAGHQDRPGSGPTTLTYTKASLLDVVEALVALTGEAHPLLPISTRHPLSSSGWRKAGETGTVG